MPTLDELGLKGFQAVAWNGLGAPARTPKEVIARIHTDVLKVMRSPEFAERLKAEGSDPIGNSPVQFAAFLREESTRWSEVIKFAGITGLQ
jgi:tripartite-type tricarboxylate transporter receptor subunit TctC